MKLFSFLFIVCSISQADILLSRALIYKQADRIYYEDCERGKTVARGCSAKPIADLYSTAATDYPRQLYVLYPANKKYKADRFLGYLNEKSQTLDEAYWSFDILKLKLAFSNIWYDGSTYLWKKASTSATHSEQFELCESPWQLDYSEDSSSFVSWLNGEWVWQRGIRNGKAEVVKYTWRGGLQRESQEFDLKAKATVLCKRPYSISDANVEWLDQWHEVWALEQAKIQATWLKEETAKLSFIKNPEYLKRLQSMLEAENKRREQAIQNLLSKIDQEYLLRIKSIKVSNDEKIRRQNFNQRISDVWDKEIDEMEQFNDTWRELFEKN